MTGGVAGAECGGRRSSCDPIMAGKEDGADCEDGNSCCKVDGPECGAQTAWGSGECGDAWI